MARYVKETREEAIQIIADLSAADTVYKRDVDEARDMLGRHYENARETVMDMLYLTPKRAGAELPEFYQDLYWDVPTEMRHLFGKKFEKALNAYDAADPMVSAIRNMQSLFKAPFDMLVDLKARQTSGRKPAPKKEGPMRDQLRAICPCCFREQAVKHGCMVAHGYELSYGFQNGNCSGKDAPHFGLPEGREYTEIVVIGSLIKMIENTQTLLQRVKDRDPVITFHKERFGKAPERIAPEDVTEWMWKDREAEVKREIEGFERHKEDLVKRVADWEPRDPITVQVPA